MRRGAGVVSLQRSSRRATGRPALRSAVALASIVAFGLSALACGSSVDQPPGTGGGGAGGGVGGEGGATVGCDGLDGPYQLRSAGLITAPGGGPWVLLQEDGTTCSAIVACNRFSARSYDVSFSAGAVALRPAGEAAVGGLLAPTQYELSKWTRISMRRNGSTMLGDGTGIITVEWIEQGSVQETYEEYIDLGVAPAANAGRIDAATQVLPWRTLAVTSNRPVAELASNLSIPGGGWDITDVVEAGAVGVGRAELSFHGSWDAVRGLPFAVTPTGGLVDLAGVSMSPVAVDFAVVDIGLAIPEHDLADPTTLATWGDVQDYDIGDCATLGCVSIKGDCHEYAGIAGQLDTTGMTEVVLSMRLLDSSQGYRVPYYWRIEVVAEDGTPLTQTSGGDFPDQESHEWTYDTAGRAIVGFAIEASARCDGFGGRLAVERVFAR